jgi:hypothetical protein
MGYRMKRVRQKDLARAFARVLRSWLTAKEWKEMRRRNAREEDSSVCHSHDFCDANMAMDEALQKLAGRAVDFNKRADEALWGKSWRLAKRKYLTEAT